MLVLLGSERLAVLERWLPNTVTILDRFHCIVNHRYTFVLQEDVLAVGSDKTEVELYSTSSGAHLQSLTGHMKR